MPLYIVRWSHESASIVHADDVDALSVVIREHGHCDAVSFDLFEGPLWLDVELCGTPSVRIADESHRALRCTVAPHLAAPSVRADADDDTSGWDDVVSMLAMARAQWIASMTPPQLREALEVALNRLDASDASQSSRCVRNRPRADT